MKTLMEQLLLKQREINRKLAALESKGPLETLPSNDQDEWHLQMSRMNQVLDSMNNLAVQAKGAK